MSRLVKYTSGAIIAVAAVAITVISGTAAPTRQIFGIGEPATSAEISRWNIDVRPDGVGLPVGQGNVGQGGEIFAERCAQCHGDFGEGLGNFPVLVGGASAELKGGDRPEKTVGSYWPYASTLFDYIHRAMPFGDAQSLSANETYALTAFLLSMNGVIPEDSVLNEKNLAAVKMPNRDGFYFDPKPDVANNACMSNCTDGPVKITSYARILDVTPDGLAPAEQAEVSDKKN